MALKKIYVSASKKSWVIYKECIFERVGILFSKDLEEPRVVQVRNITEKKWEMVCQDSAMGCDKKMIIQKIFA